jgi:DNA-binding LytR/AlgR family response regulator
MKEYVRIYLTHDKSLTTKISLVELEQIFNQSSFLRLHRSFLVAIRHIEAYSSTSVQIGGKEIPIGRQYREDIIRMLGGI